MVQRRCRLLLNFSFILACLTKAYAAEPVLFQHTPFSKVKYLLHVQAPGLLKTAQVPGDALQLVQQHQDKHHVTHARMRQTYSGFPVFGGDVILHARQSLPAMLTAGSKAVSMNGKIYKGLAADLGQPPADFVTHGADALQHFKSQWIAQKKMTDDTVSPMVYVDDRHRAHWAYKISMLLSTDNKIPERPTAIVDAKTYQVFLQWNDIKTVRSKVSGRGFGGNRHAGLHQFGVILPKLQLMRDDKIGMCYMENAHAKVVNMMHRYERRNQAMRFVCSESMRQSDNSFLTGYKGDGYDKVNGAYSPTNDALYAGNIIFDMYKNWYDIAPIEENEEAKPLIMRVHFGIWYDNAFWDGEQMTFGDGGDEFYPMVSLGVAAHEISHGFTQHHADLIYAMQPGGMNEAFSDMAAQATEYYASGTNSWTIGSELVKKASGMSAFRFMDRPSRDGKSIDDASQYTPELDVHHSSGVYNRLFYLLSTQPGWNVRKAFDVMMTANSDYWTPTTTFDEGACGILDAAQSYNYDMADVKQVLDQVGVHYSDCYDERTDREDDTSSQSS